MISWTVNIKVYILFLIILIHLFHYIHRITYIFYTDICKRSYLQYGQLGIINCKKIIEVPVNIDIYHHSSVFGNERFLIGEMSGRTKITQSGRVKLESTALGNLLNMTLIFKNVRCDDKGKLTVKFTDATEIHITVIVQGKIV